jgi:hypothetical protein
MIGFNGGLIGKDRSTSALASVPGVWTPGEQIKAQRSGFWPIVSDDPYFANVSLLLRGDGTNGSTTIIDGSSSPKTVTAFGNAQISTAQSKFGGTSIAFDGTGDYLTVASDAAFVFGTGDFTIELWIKTTDTVGGLVTKIAGGSGNWDLVLNVSNVYFQNQYFAVNLYNRNATTILDNNWHHLAVCRSGTSHRCFFDGVQQGSTVTDSNNYNGTGDLRIGSDGYGDFNGYIDDLRITKGVARYTTTFTPPGAL